MPVNPQHRIEKGSSRLRLQTIVRLRWIAVTGQVIAVLAIAFGLGFELPIKTALLIIALSAGLNLWLRNTFPARHRLSAPFATSLLVYDVLQLAALLYVTGGIQNPFAFLIIAPVTVSAATQSMASTLIIGAVTLIAAGLLAFFHEPLPWRGDQTFELPLLYRAGIWASIFCGLAFMGLYARRLAREARIMTDALAATEAVLAREQELHALDGLAAAAAHELGTPLATITVVAKELERSLPKDSSHAEEVGIIREQAQRCREILETLANRMNERDPLHAHLPLTHLISEAVEPYRVFEKEFRIDAQPAAGVTGEAAKEPVAERRPGVIHGLSNIVENAADFARSRVDIASEWTEDRVTITIADDGPGIAQALLGTLGEPYVTTRPLSGPQQDASEGMHSGGMGLGFFIAKTLLERSGAELELANREPPLSGAIVHITWSRAAFEARPATANVATGISAGAPLS